MEEVLIKSRIKSLEMELSILRALVSKRGEESTGKRLSDFRGMLKGLVSSSEEDIDNALYREKTDL